MNQCEHFQTLNLSHDTLQRALEREQYFLDVASVRRLIHYWRLGKPVGLRGEPGVGKSELPERFARLIGARLIDVECHSQLEASDIGVSWNAFKQIVDAQSNRLSGEPFSLPYLNHTPLVTALRSQEPVVLRIDEVDKLNETTSNFFLRFLDKQELVIHDLDSPDNALRALAPIYVFLTSNDYQELDGAIMRRIAWIELRFPEETALAQILEAKTPVSARVARRMAYVVHRLRQLPLKKPPSIGEALEWARAVHIETKGVLTVDAIAVTLGLLLKYPEDETRGLEELQSWAASLRA